MKIKDLKCIRCGANGKFWERENKLDCKLCGAVNVNPNKGEVPTLRPPMTPPGPNGKVPIYCMRCMSFVCRCEEQSSDTDPFMYFIMIK